HYYLSAPSVPGCRVAGDGLDVKGEGGYVLTEPSNHASGGGYHWEALYSIEDTLIAEAPPWLLGEPAKPRPEWSGASARESLLGEAFALAGLLGVELPRGVVAVKCPWADEHSDSRGKGEDSSSAILPPTPESSFGGFRC